jgi:hypothetical protein
MFRLFLTKYIFMNTNTDDVKQISIIFEDKKNKRTKHDETIKISCEKEKKMRLETNSWGLNEIDLSHNTQLSCIRSFQNNKLTKTIESHLRMKISGYKRQDQIKNKYDSSNFVSLTHVLYLLDQSNMTCCYCHEHVYILYEYVRESKQWTLDRIDNNIGHNIGNLVISCLECNLKRRRTNKDSFMFTKNMVLVKMD